MKLKTRTYENESTGEATILQEDHYYPFGMRMNGQHYTNTDLLNKFLYNGKELQEQTGYYDYGFRQLDPALGRWHVSDAMAENYMSTSPYAYTTNDPINHIDVMGLWADGSGADNEYDDASLDWNNAVRDYLADQAHFESNFLGSFADVGWNNRAGEYIAEANSAYGYWVYEYEKTVTTTTWITYSKYGITDVSQTSSTSIKKTGNRYWVSSTLLEGDPSDGENGTPKWRKALAYVLRNSRFLIIPNFPVPFFPLIIANPFYGAEAISGDIGVLGIVGEADLGAAFILSGKAAGEIVPYTETTGPSIAFELDGGIEICRIDIRGGSPDDFKKSFIFGERDKVWVTVGLQPESFGFGVGGSVAKSNPDNTSYTIIATGISVSWGLSPSPIIGGWNQGQINPW